MELAAITGCHVADPYRAGEKGSPASTMYINAARVVCAYHWFDAASGKACRRIVLDNGTVISTSMLMEEIQQQIRQAYWARPKPPKPPPKPKPAAPATTGQRKQIPPAVRTSSTGSKVSASGKVWP